jgi:hypothetical protein
VERERRSGASSVALEFKTPREPLTTFELTAPSRFNPGLRICVSGLQSLDTHTELPKKKQIRDSAPLPTAQNRWRASLSRLEYDET